MKIDESILPDGCEATPQHVQVHLVSAAGSAGQGDWEQVLHDAYVIAAIAQILHNRSLN